MNRLTADASVEDVVAETEREGFAIIEGMLSAQEAAAIRTEVTEILEATPTGRNDFEGFSTRRIYNVFAKTRSFDRLATHPLILGLLDSILGPSYQLSAPTGIEIGPGETAQNLHTDDGVYPLPRPHDEVVVNTMWALDDFTEANGATRVVRGSHRWVDERPDDSTPVLLAEMPAGSMLVFRGSLYHGGGANQTERPRFGMILEYVAGWLRPQENHLLGVPREVVRELPKRLQELLGYNIHPPFLGYVDGRHPRRALEGGAAPTPQETLATLFEGKTADEQKALLAQLERGGAAVYRALAANESDPAARDALLAAAGREDENAEVLEAMRGEADVQ